MKHKPRGVMLGGGAFLSLIDSMWPWSSLIHFFLLAAFLLPKMCVVSAPPFLVLTENINSQLCHNVKRSSRQARQDLGGRLLLLRELPERKVGNLGVRVEFNDVLEVVEHALREMRTSARQGSDARAACR